MQVINNHTGHLALTLQEGKQEHLVLLNPGAFTLAVNQLPGSSFSLHVINMGDESALQDIAVNIDGEHCSTELYGLSLTRGEQTVDVATHVLHNVGHGQSKQLFKNVLMDSSCATFYGELKVLPDAQKTEAFQTNRNILLSPTAKMRTRPQLEIYADDVKCSHGATTGQLDAQALFYMQQRGISLHDAQLLLLQAFLSDVLTSLPDDELRSSIEATIAQRLR